ncbi:MAG TPA: peptide-methionine (S)-S-oxide reductase MsrA [Gemmatimonadales bacterium]|nr:peptide-methionine (S)-S-oxide reductase MsrA [Gemmatimonadales bacterium]
MSSPPGGHAMNRLFARHLAAALAIPAAISLAGSARAAPPRPASDGREQVAVFAGGCFWGVEAVFEHLKGVKSATSGYAGGTIASPSYEQVSSGETGHAESVRVVYDPTVISYEQLLEVFFNVAHDPTQVNRQGPDVGTQYRSIVFYSDDGQKKAAEAYVAKLTAAKTFPAPIVTEIVPLRKFYQAEAYHQHYMAQHPYQPYIVFNDAPKVAHLKKAFPVLYQEPAAD